MEEFCGTPYDQIRTITNDISDNSREIHLSLGVIDYDTPYLLHYDITLHLPPYCIPKWKVRDFLSRIDMLNDVTVLEQK